MLNLPPLLKERLEIDQKLHSEVISSISAFQPWIEDNKLTFFPDYTDHGSNHLQEVIQTASSIINDESWDVLTPNDAAAICISILLHDCAMHLSEDGFYNLISDKYPKMDSRYFTEKLTWKQKWDIFLSDAKRWDGKKLHKIFGDEIPIKTIPLNKNDLTRRDKLLIGEFLRLEHAALAHSIALNGVPGPTEVRIRLAITDQKLCDIFGFIARSHNMELRQATDKIEHTQRRRILNIHAPFIMGILRISDYLQVQSSRAKKELLLVKKLSSPISVGEWKKHDSIIDIHQTHNDPEALYIDAEPDSPNTYKSLTILFSDIQRELDITWSILGEIYGRYDSLNSLGLNIRRIRSSLDNIDNYIKEKKPNFIPLPLKFKTSDAEMMNLLVAPLYGNSPEIGIRELVQNGIDACNERIDFHQKNGEFDFDLSEIGVKVILMMNSDAFTVTIIDSGVGMTLDVIENYFLNIGASFRNSDRWKKMHETDGHSNIYRTGRFGVGLLAAFLLGERIKVTTRHVTQQIGYEFYCEKKSDDIPINPTHCEIGTTISIEITEELYKKMSTTHISHRWDWYCLDYPKVIRTVKKEDKENILSQSSLVPKIGDDITDTSWHRIEHEDFDDIFWSMHFDKSYIINDFPSLVCNGIKINISRSGIKANIAQSPFDIRNKDIRLVIFDQDGRLPINLQRNGLTTEKLPFHTQLITAISIKIAEQFLEKIKGIDRELGEDLIKKMLDPGINELEENYHLSENAGAILYSKGKLIPCHSSLITELKPNSILIDPVSDFDSIGSWDCNEIINEVDIYMPYNIKRRSKSAKVHLLRRTLDRNDFFSGFPICGKQILIKKEEIPQLVSQGNFPKTKWAQFKTEWESQNWILASMGDTSSIKCDINNLAEKLDLKNQNFILIIHFDWNKEYEPSKENNDGIFTRAWKSISGSLMI